MYIKSKIATDTPAVYLRLRFELNSEYLQFEISCKKILKKRK